MWIHQSTINSMLYNIKKTIALNGADGKLTDLGQ